MGFLRKHHIKAGLLLQDGRRDASAAGNRALGSPGAGVNGKKWLAVLLHPVDREAKKYIYLFVIIHSRGN